MSKSKFNSRIGRVKYTLDYVFGDFIESKSKINYELNNLVQPYKHKTAHKILLVLGLASIVAIGLMAGLSLFYGVDPIHILPPLAAFFMILGASMLVK